MSYRIRFTFPNGTTGVWALTYPTREAAQHAVREREADTGLAYTVEEVPEPGSTAAHHVEILRARVKDLEDVQKAIHRDLLFALEIGQAMREAMRTGEWRAGHDRGMANSAIAGWDRWKASLATSLQGTAKASEAPGEGGDSDRRRLEALERWLRSKEDVSIVWMENRCLALNETGLAVDWGWSLAALADKLAEKEDKP